ncbi:hypothetical protein [Mucilaginibacter humi]|uniref:hypothetical protein n=1 Tax=Mucilaginibacter humi TaxID=2732510 RepID=UPI001C2E07F8|nr:hypothetical protein [Mucilaginibacter humi]
MKKYYLFFSALLFVLSVQAQDNYEIEVYGSPTVEKGRTMVELHSNYTTNGSKFGSGPELPTNHVLHETIELTHGWTTGSKPDSIFLIQ